ncbi:MAG: Signal recognition particle 54 kDa protein [Pseudomonadota bacterium]|jgi:flagellar biosynthesis GTPase FlhF
MELKRILAKDLRRATEKAVKLYGEDVLFVSNAKVNGQHEVIVAVDLAPESVELAPGKGDAARFGAALHASFRELEAGATATDTIAVDDDDEEHTYEAPLKAKKAAAQSAHAAPAPVASRQAEDHRDYIRGREIVDMVRDELAAIRKEFKLAQRVAAWQTEAPSHAAVRPLVTALAEASISVSLRTLLVDTVSTMDDLQQAQDAMKAQLVKSIGEHWAKLPQRGVHAIAGPAGSGKTMMVARLARAAAERKGPESVAVISYCDQRAGAWSQIQMLCAQAGVDCLRASDPETLKMLLGELGGRTLVLIDTPGVEVAARAEQLAKVSDDIAIHLVLPADASGTTVRRHLLESKVEWASLMASRMDEATQPWALLQVLCEKPVPLSAASHSPSANEGSQVLTATELVSLAIRGLGLEQHIAEHRHLVADELVDEINDPSVVTAAHALVARIEKSAHATS